jgi:hypothetical protein
MCLHLSRIGIAAVALSFLCTLEARAEERAFKLRGTGAGQLYPDGSGFHFTASGQATHLGPWTNEGDSHIVGQDADGNLLVSGSVTYTAKNGDELWAVFHGTLDPNTGAGVATFYWVGGTGRFTDASGSAGFVVQNGPTDANGKFAFEFVSEGGIDY